MEIAVALSRCSSVRTIQCDSAQTGSRRTGEVREVFEVLKQKIQREQEWTGNPRDKKHFRLLWLVGWAVLAIGEAIVVELRETRADNRANTAEIVKAMRQGTHL